MDIVKEKVAKIEKTIDNKIKDRMETIIEDKDEIEERKYNLVIFELPEKASANRNTPWSTEEKIKYDTQTMKDIITHDLGVGLSPKNDIYHARRLGGWKKGVNRPLKITFDSIYTKRDVLSHARSLRDSEDPVLQKIYINPDLTEKQREEDKALRKQMWERRGNNENVVIRRGQIVKADHEVRKTRSVEKTKDVVKSSSKKNTNSETNNVENEVEVVDNTSS